MNKWMALALMAVLYGLSVALGIYVLPGYRHASGVVDLGHRLVPSLLSMVGPDTARYVFWLGTLPLELFFVGIVLVILFTGKGIRLGMCLYVSYFLHWLFLPATTGEVEEYAWLVGLLATPLGRALSGSVVTLDGALDNWTGPWPPHNFVPRQLAAS